MTDHIYQCCFTRIDGQTQTSGWQVTHATDQIPSEAVRYFSLVQNANVLNKIPYDENGNLQDVIEFTSDGTYFFVTYIRYGLSDNFNRQNNMFAHGYLFCVKDQENLVNPNIITALSRDNFHLDLESTKITPMQLNYQSEWTVEKALQQVMLSQQNYKKLIRTVYAQLESKSGRSLYLIGNTDFDSCMAVWYLILSALPYELRRHFCAASAYVGSNNQYQVIMANKVPANEYYFDLRIGKSNLLTERVEYRLERYGYVDYYVDHYEDSMDQYFTLLEDKVLELAQSVKYDVAAYKLAHPMILKEQQENQISMLYEHIRAAFQLSPSKQIEGYIAKWIRQVIQQQKLLLEDLEEKLNQRISCSSTDSLIEIAKEYFFYKIENLSIENAAKEYELLVTIRFQAYREELKATERGCQILDEYYQKKAANIERKVKAFQSLCEEVNDLLVKPNTLQGLKKVGKELFNNYLSNQEALIENFMVITESIHHAYSQELEHEFIDFRDSLKMSYWNRLSLASFSKNEQDKYYFFQCNQMMMSRVFMQLLSLVMQEEQRKMELSYLIDIQKFARTETKFVKDNIENILLILNSEDNTDSKNLQTQWYRIALSITDESCLILLKRYEKLIQINAWDQILNQKSPIVAKLYSLKSSLSIESFLEIWNILWILLQSEDDQVMIPLSILLTFGAINLDNPFEALDIHDWRVLHLSMEELVKEAECITKQCLWDSSDEYAHSHALNAKKVKELRAVLQKQRKQQEREEQKQQKEELRQQKNQQVMEKHQDKQESSRSFFRWASKKTDKQEKSDQDKLIQETMSQEKLNQDRIVHDLPVQELKPMKSSLPSHNLEQGTTYNNRCQIKENGTNKKSKFDMRI